MAKRKVLDLFKIEGKWMTDFDLMVEYGERGYEEAEDYVRIIIEEKDIKSDSEAIALLKEIAENYEECC
ncbi:hypothetical protein E3E35_08085 [Thermococcus sp. GR7]|uniref:hypothetical protein n=1 Tax=unclassified Thermococcus TaxID=2627626 RepID=UPI001431C2D7|nr:MULTISPECIES: hypothetical protein [unclassified Thermococcus]NJE47356.1 hypothetical protein [Thermococcus sp. GR7]NJE78851.1 hypothetical protein [Thermococcus sp. GR4]NJF23154.1 hypothetical protein [Thermococcus sp. GR5]